MNLITSITDSPNQTLNLILDDGSKVLLTLCYKSNQQGWFYSLTWGTFTVNNRRIVASPNMLRAFRDIISFGLACTVSDGYEPVFADDFSTERARFYLLNASDVGLVETLLIPTFRG